jgi:hypothetical protein
MKDAATSGGVPCVPVTENWTALCREHKYER